MRTNSAVLPRGRKALGQILRSRQVAEPAPICLFCAHAPTSRTSSRPRSQRNSAIRSRRYQSTSSAAVTSSIARKDLHETLTQLQNECPNLVSLARLQLALQGLQQAPGTEAVRVAILSLPSKNESGNSAGKDVLRLLLADPLKDEEAWERQLAQHPTGTPLIVRIRVSEAADGTLNVSTANTIPEVDISSAELNSADLELLLMEAKPSVEVEGAASQALSDESLLEPEVEIPASTDRFTPLATPVHKTILVGSGFSGAVDISGLSLKEGEELIKAAVDFQGLGPDSSGAGFEIIDVARADQGLKLFRQGPQHAIEYERLWYAGNLPALTTWLRSGIKSPEGTTKPAVRNLITSLLNRTLSKLQAKEAEASLANVARSSVVSANPELQHGLASWAQNAHSELQDQLDLAFTGRRWRKLGWWKLFWRVDDVAMLTNEMLSQRFLPTAEQELVYLTGQIKAVLATEPEYSQPMSSIKSIGASSEMKRLGSGELAPVVFPTTAAGLPKWPGHIAFTRRYLQNETIPALQALAQKLVMQSLGTSGLATSLAALLYVSSFASTIYEAGAVAALGAMYSLARMQKKWETARGFWEGEVREEGRKAVRAAEESVADSILGSGSNGSVSVEREAAALELKRARELVAKAQGELEKLA